MLDVSRDSWHLNEGIDATHLVLEAVRLHGDRSRNEISERTGLGRAVVAQRVRELVQAGIIEQAGPGRSRGGRPPRDLRFRSEAGHVVGVDVGATSIDVAVTDLTGRILAHRAEPADVADGPEPILGEAERLADECLAETGLSGRSPLGIGIGLPGPVEFGTGRPVSPPIMPGWDDYPVRERLSARYGSPVWVDNDVNILALAEWRSGAAQGHANMVYVKIGTGIGAGLISDGMLHRGAQGCAGDVGHAQVTDDASVICRCGNIGCLEALASGHALGRAALELATDGGSLVLGELLLRDGKVSARSVAEAARRGDPSSVALLVRSGRLIGRMLATIVNFFNPSLIVIGGGVSAADGQILAAIRETIYRRSPPLATRSLQIVPSSLGELGGIIGAVAMVTDELFSREGLPDTIARHSSAMSVGAASETREERPG